MHRGRRETVDEEVFERFAKRLSYASGDFADAATFDRVAAAIPDAKSPVFYLEIPPFLFGAVIHGPPPPDSRRTRVLSSRSRSGTMPLRPAS